MGGGGGGYTGGIRGPEELKDLARKKIQGGDKKYGIFIPHAWSYDEEYKRLVSLLEGDDEFDFRDFSVPKEDPLDAESMKELYEKLENQIKPTSVVVIPAGMYAAHSEWIEKEIEIAKKYDKPIVAVRPWGSERIPQIIQENANKIVGWNRVSIIDAIREVTGNED